MRAATFTTLVASLAALASATPVDKRQIDHVSITFYTTQNDQWHEVFPTDMSPTNIHNSMPVTHIYNPGGAVCVFSGTEGGTFTVHIGDHKLDPPQSLKSGFCNHL